MEYMEARNMKNDKVERKVGTRVTYSGYEGTIIEVHAWAPTMVTVRLKSGPVCVTLSDLKPL